jgi:folylpolyglutamate synthase/dihydrofolate synthase
VPGTFCTVIGMNEIRTFDEAMQYVNTISASGSVLGLDTIRNLMEVLGNPQDELKIIHIAGTNGKGSVLAFSSSILMSSGYKVGTFSSPCVMGYLEKFRINGKWMEEDEFVFYLNKVRRACEVLKRNGKSLPTVFEFETAAAFLYFKENECDYVVLETGLGGDLDSTNIVSSPMVCAFASVSMDHMGVLGNTLPQIAVKKAGIIKPGCDVIAGWQKAEVLEVIKAKCSEKGSFLKTMGSLNVAESDIEKQVFDYDTGKDSFRGFEIHMAGKHQCENACTAIEIALSVQRRAGRKRITKETIRKGLAAAAWPGRLEIVCTDPLVIIDGAHNEDAAYRLSLALEEYFSGTDIFAAIGVFKDKEYTRIAKILSPHLKKVYTFELPDRERTLDSGTLRAVFEKEGIHARECAPFEAVKRAAEDAAMCGGAALITGSLSFLGSAGKYIRDNYPK